ncbi:MAG: hypothetical protein L6Q35_15445, partial [Phycisphaerales bacterium]|nr:hypothetical protein [Phycisphaerales bacterium]
MGQGPSFEAAKEKLIDAIGDACGDFEPEFTFTTPLPVHAQLEKYVKDGLCLVGGNGQNGFERTPIRELFSGGRCKHCLFPRGRRTNKPRRIANGMTEHLGGGGWNDGSSLFVSEEFLEMLTAQ